MLNNNIVPTDWELKGAFGLDAKKKEIKIVRNDAFKIQPERGSLLPNQKQNIQIVFTPVSHGSYTQTLEFKLKSNDNFKLVTCKGQGFIPKFEIEYPILNLDPIFPFKETEYKLLKIFNKNNFPVEIVAQELDHEYHNELKELDIYPKYENDQILLPIRKPGDKLWKEILDTNSKNALMEQMKKEYENKLALAEKRRADRKKLFDDNLKLKLQENPQYVPDQKEIDDSDRLSVIEEPNYDDIFAQKNLRVIKEDRKN